MWNEDQDGESDKVGGSGLRPSSRRGGIGLVNGGTVNKIGIWVEGVDRLGAAYEGVWRVIKRFLLSSENSSTGFSFVAPARFQREIEDFLNDLPDSVRTNVRICPFGDESDEHAKGEAVRQAGFANQLDVDAWLVPNPMWAAAKHLTGPKVVWFHDFLLAEFPQSYPQRLFLEFQNNIRDLTDSGAFFIFLSPHVKQKHGHEVCGISPDRSMLVVTPSIDVSTALADLPEDPWHGGELIRSELRDNLKSWCTPAHAELFYHHIASYPFESVPYFFVSSQNREHKGFLRLAQIHAKMLRRHYLPYSIFTTGLVDVAGQSPLEQFLRKELLMGDFMSVGKVSDVTLALMYKFARLTIHPSTFEGNLPLPFAESVSVGTPCIVPYSRAFLGLVDNDMHPWIFYSPTEAGLIAKVKEVEGRQPEFLNAQKQILETMRSYSLRDYFKLQMKAFEAAGRIEPDAAQYYFEAEEKSSAAPDRKSLTEYLSLSMQQLGLARNVRRQPTEDPGRPVQARIWPQFELSSASAEGSHDDGPVLHWAAYLGGAHPKGDSYFVIRVDGNSDLSDPAELKLFAEIGAWIDDDYEAAEGRAFCFDELDGLPPEVAELVEQTGIMSAFDGSSRIGWTRLNWNRGIVPEIRVGGHLPVKDSALKARVVCATDLGSQAKPRRPVVKPQAARRTGQAEISVKRVG